MEIENFLKILKNIEILLKNGDLFETREYIKIEIENIRGITQINCKNRYYSFYNYYCDGCNNFNCSNNCNIKLKNKRGGGNNEVKN